MAATSTPRTCKDGKKYLKIVLFLVCELLIPNINCVSCFFFRTSLHCAAANNSIEMCKFLINHGACVFAVTAIEGKTPSRCCEKESENYEKCFTFLSGKRTAEFVFPKRHQTSICGRSK